MPDASGQPAPIPRDRSTRQLVLEGAESFFYAAGPTGCLLLHGFTSSPFTMREMGAHLAASGVTVCAPLLAGHGTSPEDLRTKTWQDWVASADEGLAQLRAYGCKRIYLAGLSLGGALTLYLAARDPDAYAGMVVMSAPVWIPAMLRLPLTAVSDAVPYFNKRFSDIAEPGARVRHLTYSRIPLAAAATLIDLLAQMRPALGRITIPALIIYARHDHLVHPVNSMHIYSHIASRDKRLVVLHRGFHIVTVDRDKDRVFQLAAEFMHRED